jgi:hypothetical protein
VYCLSAFSFPWFTTAQTYIPSTLFLFASVAVSLSSFSKTSLQSYIAGSLFAAACLIRLPFGITLPCLMYLTICRSETPWKNLVIFLLGGVIICLPFTYIVLLDPEAAWFNNLGYHLTRSDMSTNAVWEAKMKILSVVTGLRQSKKFIGIDYPFILWGSLLCTLLRFIKYREVNPYYLVGLSLAVVCVIPTPMYVQYFSVTLPFFLTSLLQDSWILTQGTKLPTTLAKKILLWTPHSFLVCVVLIAAPADLLSLFDLWYWSNRPWYSAAYA